MALPASGAISLNDVNVELGNAATDEITLNDYAVRTLAGVPSGEIGMDDLYGKSFIPAAVSGLGLDLDASYGVLTTISPDVPAVNNAPVRMWLDKSGNGLHFEQSVAINQPLFLSSGLNGNPCVSFDGINDYLDFLSSSLLQNVTGVTFFMVVEMTSAPTNPTSYFTATNNSTNPRFVASRELIAGNQRYMVQVRRLDGDSGARFSGLAPESILQPVVVSYRHDYSTATSEIFYKGSNILTGSLGTSGATSDTASTRLRIGARGGGVTPSAYTPINISRMLVWPRILTTNERSRVETYLADTYSIPLL